MRVPYLRPTLWLIMMVWANQLVRSSGPSTESTKSFWALIWLSQLIGGISSEAPTAAFLNISLQSGCACSPAPERIVPSRNSNQRPISSSRVMICATKLRSLMRFQNASCRRALYLSISDRPNRMSESLVVASIMVSSCRTPILNSANDLDAGRAQLARARSVRHNALDLACTQGDERRNAANQRFVNACAWLRKTEAAQHSAIAVEDRRADAGAAGIDLAMCDADAGAPEARERAAELIEAPAEPCCCNLVGVVGEQRFQRAGRQ